MSRRITQVNELLRFELANIISKDIEIKNGLITIIYVKCSPDMKEAKVGISVLPENLSGTALQYLRKGQKSFTETLRKKLRLKFIPRLNWIIDENERYSAEIEKTLQKIRSEEY